MQLYPAIDMKNGKCVRLRQGAFKDITVYSEHPEEIAALWQEKGATFLHLVDLDGALAGRSVNEETIKKIVSSVNIPVEIGGGIRSEEAIKNMLALGVKRVIIGTKAVEEPEFLKDMVEKFGADAIAAGVDAKDGMVAIQGWKHCYSHRSLPENERIWRKAHYLYRYFQRRHAFRPQYPGNKEADGRNRT